MIFKFFLWNVKEVSGRQKAFGVPKYVLGHMDKPSVRGTLTPNAATAQAGEKGSRSAPSWGFTYIISFHPPMISFNRSRK